MSGSSIYIVTFTKFVDDYKLRGQDPSYVEGTYAFSSKKLANAHVDFRLKEYVEEYYDTNCDNTDPDNPYRIYFDDDGNLEDEGDIRSVFFRMTKGEFVPKRFDYDISKMEVDEYAILKPKVKKHKK